MEGSLDSSGRAMRPALPATGILRYLREEHAVALAPDHPGDGCRRFRFVRGEREMRRALLRRPDDRCIAVDVLPNEVVRRVADLHRRRLPAPAYIERDG